MTIVRGPRPESGFTMLDNDVLRDKRLSFRARGLLVSILSRPDDWRTDARLLAQEGKEGRAAILTALRELVDAGYIVRERIQDPNSGKWKTVQTVYDRPKLSTIKATEVQFPNAGFPNAGFPDSIRSNETNIPLSPNKRKPCSTHKRAKEYCSDCQRANTPKPIVPEWCGECDPQGKEDPFSRWMEVTGEDGVLRAMRCPYCYPRKASA